MNVKYLRLWRSALLLTLQCFIQVGGSQRIDCNPCIARKDYVIKVISHGSTHSVFWRTVEAAIRRAGEDMGVTLDMKLYDEFDPYQMTIDIEYEATREDPPDALLITIPSDVVHDAVRKVVAAGIPVFGFNSGYDQAQDLGLLGFVSQNEYLGGIEAGNEFLTIKAKKNETIQKALYINNEKGNTALDLRFKGFNHTMYEKVSIMADELVINETDTEGAQQLLNEAFRNGCPYDIVLLGGSVTAVYTVTAMLANNCEDKITIGTFDEGSFVTTSIIQGYIAFATSQQKYIQGVLPVIMASMYVTTGKKFALPAESNVYLTGPYILNANNVPSDTWLTCENEAFPVCPNHFALDGSLSECSCFDRSEIRIAGVLHGVTTDKFWDPVFAAAEQAGKDMGIELDLERFEPESDTVVFENKMASRITTLCRSGVDGIFVTIPSDVIANAIKICQLLNIPVISVNAGADIAEELKVLQHIGQLEYIAGYRAGEHLVKAGMKTGYCFNQAPEISSTIERCEGFADAIADSQIDNSDLKYGGMVNVPLDNKVQYLIDAEEAVGNNDGDWEGVGILLLGPSQIKKGALDLKTKHEKLLMGSFDIVDDMFPLIDDGRLLFGIDQQPLLQGSTPVYLLAYAAYTKQQLLNKVVQTGPVFVTTLPTPQEQDCESKFYEVCSLMPRENLNYISTYATTVGYIFVAIGVCTGLISLYCISKYHEKNIIRVSQPKFLIMIIVGCILSTVSIIPMGTETSYRYEKDLLTGRVSMTTENPKVFGVDFACMAFPWMYGIGFVLTFSTLLAKMYRVKLIYKAGQSMIRKKVGVRDVLPIIIGMFTVELAILFTWQFVSPHRWEREVILESPDGYALESVGSCHSEHGWFFMLGLVLFHMICLCYALILCFQTKNIPTEFSESSWVSLSILCIFQVHVLALPISAMVRDDTTVFYFVRVCALFLQNFTVQCLIFGPKIHRIINGDNQMPSIRSNNNSFRVNSTINLTQCVQCKVCSTRSNLSRPASCVLRSRRGEDDDEFVVEPTKAKRAVSFSEAVHERKDVGETPDKGAMFDASALSTIWSTEMHYSKDFRRKSSLAAESPSEECNNCKNDGMPCSDACNDEKSCEPVKAAKPHEDMGCIVAQSTQLIVKCPHCFENLTISRDDPNESTA